MFVCSAVFAGDQEFASVNAWGKLHVFKTCEKIALMYRTYDAESNFWSPWVSILKLNITSPPSAVLTDNGTRLAVYFRGPDGILSQVYTDQGKGWTDLFPIGDRRMYSSPTAVVVGDKLTVFARTQDCRLMKIFYDKQLGRWTNWSDIDLPKNTVTVDQFAGTWTVKYSHGSVRNYAIAADGKVSAKVDDAELKGEITKHEGHWLLIFPGDGKLERISLTSQGKLFVEHFNPREAYFTASKLPNVTGHGEREQQAQWETREFTFGADEKEWLRRLGELKAVGWEADLLLGGGRVLFKTRIPGKEAAVKADIAALQGTWYMSTVAEGVILLGENKNETITYEGNHYGQRRDGQVIAAGTFSIVDASAHPKRIDVQCTEGPSKGTYCRSIYTVSGDDYQICSDSGNDQRPQEFSGKSGLYRITKPVK